MEYIQRVILINAIKICRESEEINAFHIIDKSTFPECEQLQSFYRTMLENCIIFPLAKIFFLSHPVFWDDDSNDTVKELAKFLMHHTNSGNKLMKIKRERDE